MRKINLSLLSFCCLAMACADAGHAASPEITGTYTLPRISLSQFGNPACTKAALEKAKANGLAFTDLPSIGSGLAKVGKDEYVGITDRGPNGKLKLGSAADPDSDTDDEEDSVRTFPLPQFCPTIVRFKMAGKEIQITEFIPLSDSHGKLISGLSNLESEERLFESADAISPLPLDPSGVDPEAIRLLPDGNFLISEEYSPSLLVVSPKGQVLVRYTPESKLLAGAGYPVKPILPGVFAQRPRNHGFEGLAVSRGGDRAWLFLQAPMKDEEGKKQFNNTRVVRVLELDISKPLNARCTGEYLMLASKAEDYSKTQKQAKLSISDAEWIADEKILVIERGKGLGKVLLVNFSKATNILGRKDAGTLAFENTETDLSDLGIKAAKVTEVFSTDEVKGIDSDKLEGLALIAPDEIALTNDNDFGIGDNTTGAPSKLWTIRIPKLRELNR